MYANRDIGEDYMKKIQKVIVSLILMTIFMLTLSVVPVRADFSYWYGLGWNYGQEITLTENAGIDRTNEIVDLFLVLEPGQCTNASKEVRVIASDNSQVPSQVYNVTTQGEYVSSCNVVFPANVSASSNQTYYVIYGNSNATAPTYDGLRLHTQTPGSIYNVTALNDGIEKNYARIYWQNLLNLYANGTTVTWPGGIGLGTINLGSLWADAWDTAWFGAGKKLKVLNSGPVFVDFNYSETYASDLFGSVFDFNVSTTSIIRVYYQPNLNPLVKVQKTFNIKTNLANYTIKSPLYMDFTLANSTLKAIYQNFTWKNDAGITNSTASETSITDNIWSTNSQVGWWTYNGSRTDSTDKPAANIGLIPISANGTVPGDYTLKAVQEIEYNNHHCSQYFAGSYNGTTNQYIKVSDFIVTYDLQTDAETSMDRIATTLRSPLTYSVGAPFVIPEFSVMWIPLISIVMVTTLLIAMPLALKHKRRF
jgi:hypothetical protein